MAGNSLEERADRELALVRRIATDAAKPSLPMARADELTAGAKPIEWLARPLLERDTLAQLIGPPRSLKSFLALDVACSIATGREWLGFELTRAPVLIMAGEGHAGIARRLKAWEIAHQVSLKDCPLYVTRHAVALDDLVVALTVTAALEQIAHEHGTPPALVVVDTMARHHTGDENDAGAIGRLVQIFDTYIRRPFGTTVLTVHHSGLADAGRARGSSALRAAVDTEWLAERTDRVVTIRCNKSKDADEGEPISFELRVVELPWLDDVGQPVTSAVLVPTDRATPVAVSLGKHQRAALATLKRLQDEYRTRLTDAGHDPDTARVSIEDWRAACDLDRFQWRDVQAALKGRELILIEHPYVRSREK